MKIGNKLTELLIRNILTQQQVADSVKISHSAISQYENDVIEPTATAIARFAELYCVSADYILGLEDDLGNKNYNNLQNAVTPEERKILNAYRELTPSNRELVLRMLKLD